MARTLVVMQPGYLPWLGFFELMFRSDVFVLYDTVQCDREGWRNRNCIKGVNGSFWLTVPVLWKESRRGTGLIKDIRIDNTKPWRQKHREAIRQAYARAPYFGRYFPEIATLYGRSQPWESLLELDFECIRLLSSLLGLRRDIRLASDYPQVPVHGDRVERLIQFCRVTNANCFYEPAGGKSYLVGHESRFREAGVELQFQEYRHPTHAQLHGGFIPNLSVVDLLFNEGPRSLSVLALRG